MTDSSRGDKLVHQNCPSSIIIIIIELYSRAIIFNILLIVLSIPSILL